MSRSRLRRYEMAMAAFRAARMATSFEEFSHLKIDWTNIYPSHLVPIIRLNEKGERELTKATWGFIPHWSKERPKKPPHNARCETLATNGMFRDAFAFGRCLIPADGFYEGIKQKLSFIQRKDEALFAFAGIYDRWDSGDGIVDTCAIITTEPNAFMKPIHHRMPIIFREQDYDLWLDRNTSNDELEILLNKPDGMEQYQAEFSRPSIPNNEESLFG
jgi:putative SOS response-associated peptidase YedK